MSRQRALRIGFVVYWAAFVLFAVQQGRYPGIFDDPARWPYPYAGVARVCIFITLLLAVLCLIYPPSGFPYSRRRIGFAIAYAAVLLTLGLGAAYTDQPAYYYVPLQFEFVTFVVTIGLTVSSAIYALKHRRAGAA